MSTASDFLPGDRAILDSKVPGKVHGWYYDGEKVLVVFQPDYKFTKVLYGRMPMSGHDDDGNNEWLGTADKIFTLSLILVHPSNLRREQ